MESAVSDPSGSSGAEGVPQSWLTFKAEVPLPISHWLRLGEVMGGECCSCLAQGSSSTPTAARLLGCKPSEFITNDTDISTDSRGAATSVGLDGPLGDCSSQGIHGGLDGSEKKREQVHRGIYSALICSVFPLSLGYSILKARIPCGWYSHFEGRDGVLQVFYSKTEPSA